MSNYIFTADYGTIVPKQSILETPNRWLDKGTGITKSAIIHLYGSHLKLYLNRQYVKHLMNDAPLEATDLSGEHWMSQKASQP